MSAKKKNIISKASPHTIKKFELIEEYIKSWAQKLLLTESCNGLIFIDCMCNSGVYTDDAGQWGSLCPAIWILRNGRRSGSRQ